MTLSDRLNDLARRLAEGATAYSGKAAAQAAADAATCREAAIVCAPDPALSAHSTTSRPSCRRGGRGNAIRQVTEHVPHPVLAGRVRECAAQVFGVTEDDILGYSRVRAVVRARWAATVILRDCGWSYPGIADRLRAYETGHSGIIEADRAARKLMERDPEFAALVEQTRLLARVNIGVASHEEKPLGTGSAR